jgi:hypothetical protein
MSILNFDKFITPSLIKWIWIIGAIVYTLIDLISVAYLSFLLRYVYLQSLFVIAIIDFVLILLIIFVNIIWRVICEYLVIQFKILDKLNAIEINTRNS